MIPTRYCTCCNAKAIRGIVATFVARDADGLEWFECGSHTPTDNVVETRRVSLTPIADWFRKNGLGS